MKHGPAPKSAGRRQRRNRQPHLEVHTGAVPDIQSSNLPAVRSEMPPYPKSILKVTKGLWRTYWQSEVSVVAGAVDMPVVERLHRRYDERERAYREVRKSGRLAIGSQGQKILHPLLKYIDQCEQEIRQLEDRLGLSPHARLRMGAVMAGAKRTLEAVNEGLDKADEEDPR
jgi:P27 family predicted phage terminase small subunit